MNSLFHKFQSRQFQFSLDLMARLTSNKEVPNQTLYDMSVQYGLDHAGKCIDPLIAYGLLKKTSTGVRMADNMLPPQVPLSDIEEEYLQYILRLPEEKLFLPSNTHTRLLDLQAKPQLGQIQRHQACNREPVPDVAHDQFRNLLRAAREKRWIHYSYLSKGNTVPQNARAIPWKLEHSVYDGRWWIILYLPDEQRTVKARLSNLQDIRLGSRSDVTDEQIELAMEKLLEEAPVVIRIAQEKNALERCAKVFERQMLQQIRRESDTHHILTFRYYKFDRTEILRKLLYLGPAVQLLEPEDLRRDLLDLINSALEG